MNPVEGAQRSPFARRCRLERVWNGRRKVESGGYHADEQAHKHRTVVVVGMIHDRLIQRSGRGRMALEVRVHLERMMMISRIAVGVRVYQRR